MVQNVLQAVGHTPLIELQRMVEPDAARILVKYEGVNIGGSIKTRTAFAMLRAARQQGIIDDESIIVEPTSGNQGIGLALVGAVMGYETLIIMPDSVSEERRKIIKQYGAKVKLIHDQGNIGDCIKECVDVARSMKENDPRVYVPQQFTNEANIRAHYEGTGQEILADADGPIHGFCSGIGTGGTITGIGRALREKNSELVIWAAEPEHAAILSGQEVGTHVQMGIGDGIVPEILDQKIYEHIEIVKDEEAIEVARMLARKEGLMCGISSGTNVAVAMRLARILGKGKTVVTVLPDTGERYYSTQLFDGE